MSYQIRLTETAQLMLKGISDRRIRKKIGKRIDDLAVSPEQQGKALKGRLSGYRSVRAVGQRYRIIYRIIQSEIVVLVVGVGLRKEDSKRDVYQQLRKLLSREK